MVWKHLWWWLISMAGGLGSWIPFMRQWWCSWDSGDVPGAAEAVKTWDKLNCIHKVQELWGVEVSCQISKKVGSGHFSVEVEWGSAWNPMLSMLRREKGNLCQQWGGRRVDTPSLARPIDKMIHFSKIRWCNKLVLLSLLGWQSFSYKLHLENLQQF